MRHLPGPLLPTLGALHSQESKQEALPHCVGKLLVELLFVQDGKHTLLTQAEPVSRGLSKVLVLLEWQDGWLGKGACPQA